MGKLARNRLEKRGREDTWQIPGGSHGRGTMRHTEPLRGGGRGKVIITCAVTGSIHTPTMSPYLPLTPDEVARDAIAAAEAGAAILHLHARDPKDGRPTPDPDVFMQFLPRIKQATNAVVNITTGGGHGMTLEERLAAPLW